MRAVLACVGDGSIIAQNRGQGVIVMVERGCDDLPLKRVVGQFSGYLSVTIEPRYHPRVRLRASYENNTIRVFRCAPCCLSVSKSCTRDERGHPQACSER